MRFYEIPYTDEYSFYYKQSPDYYTACDEIGAKRCIAQCIYVVFK